jgi:signal transduction histidine kinase
MAVRVADAGPGVAAGEASRIFEKFYRARQGPGATEGTGLGLAICRAIVEAHGGKIWVESGPQRRGATFAFTLPATSPGGEPGPAVEAGGGEATEATAAGSVGRACA